jgi:hypothetical protein
MPEESRLGYDDGILDEGRDIGGEPDPIWDLVCWTNDVRAIERAAAVFTSLEPVIDDKLMTCWLLCGSQEGAVEVYRYLDEHAEELSLIPELVKEKALVYVMHHSYE